MSDLPPPGSEPVPPTPSGPPADPTAPPPAATDPAVVGERRAVRARSRPAARRSVGRSDRPRPEHPATTRVRRAARPPGPARPGHPARWGRPGRLERARHDPPGQAAPHGTPPSGWSAPGGTPPPGWSTPGTPPRATAGPRRRATPAAGLPRVPATPRRRATRLVLRRRAGAGTRLRRCPAPPTRCPAGPGAYAGWFPGIDPQDPLVNPPHAGIGPWFARCWGALRRGWRQLLPIVLLTQVVPATVIGVLTLIISPDGQMATAPNGAPALPEGFWAQTLGFYGAILFAGLIFGALQAMGWAAGTWVIARQAAGQPAGLGAAFRYGLSRALGLWGWTIVVSLLVTLGACFCLLPGLYAALALALFGPVYLFERRDPVGRSWQMFHSRFGMVLGRVALVVAALVAATLLDVVLAGINVELFGVEPMGAVGTAIGAVTITVLSAVVAAPTYLAQQVGLVVTYAEQRAQEGPVTAAQLAAELG